jgi:hypothetical protein
VEVALAVVVLRRRRLFLRAFMQTRNEDPGFRRDGVLLAATTCRDATSRGRTQGASPRRCSSACGRCPASSRRRIGLSVPLDIHGMPTRFFTLEGRARSDDALDER